MSAGSKTKVDREAEKWLAVEPRSRKRKATRSSRPSERGSAAAREWLPAQVQPETVEPPPGNGSRKPAGPQPGRRRLALRLRRAERKLAEAEERVAELEQRNAELEARLAERQPRKKAAAKRPAKAAPKRRSAAGKGKLDANEVSFEQLRELGLTVTQSARFIAYRDIRNGFTSAAAFDDIPGFSGTALAELKTRLRVPRAKS